MDLVFTDAQLPIELFLVYLSVSDQLHVKVGECTKGNFDWIGAIEGGKVTGKERKCMSEFVKI